MTLTTKDTFKNKYQQRHYLVMFMRFFLIFFIKTYVVGTHLNCIDKSMQFKWVPTTCAFTKKHTGCNFKTAELLDCALIGVCVLIRSNTVGFSQKSVTGWLIICHLIWIFTVCKGICIGRVNVLTHCIMAGQT